MEIIHRPFGASKNLNEGKISLVNSTNVALGISGVFTGTLENVKDYGIIILSIKTDQDSALNGLEVQFSPDGTNWDHKDNFTIYGGTGKTFSFQASANCFRVVYTNGSIAQGFMRMQVIFKPMYVKPSSHRISDKLSGEDDAELVKAIISGARDDGVFDNAILDNNNNLRVNSFPYTYAIAEGAISGHKALLKFGTRSATATTQSTVWEGTAARYEYLTTASVVRATCGATDGGTTTGLRTITIHGLDANWEEQSVDIPLTTSGSVDTTGYTFIRIFRAYGTSCGTAGTNNGDIDITAVTGGTQLAIIKAGDSQTLMAMWTVPAGKVAYMTTGSASTSTAKGVSIGFFARFNDGFLYPWRIQYRAWIFQGNEVFPFTIPFVIPAKTDLEVRGLPGQVSAIGATFELWYEDI